MWTWCCRGMPITDNDQHFRKSSSGHRMAWSRRPSRGPGYRRMELAKRPRMGSAQEKEAIVRLA